MLMQIPGVVCRKPEGAFYLMAKLPVDSTDKFQLWMLEHFSANGDTVMITPGEGFYTTPGKGVDEPASPTSSSTTTSSAPCAS